MWEMIAVDYSHKMFLSGSLWYGDNGDIVMVYHIGVHAAVRMQMCKACLCYVKQSLVIKVDKRMRRTIIYGDLSMEISTPKKLGYH